MSRFTSLHKLYPSPTPTFEKPLVLNTISLLQHNQTEPTSTSREAISSSEVFIMYRQTDTTNFLQFTSSRHCYVQKASLGLIFCYWPVFDNCHQQHQDVSTHQSKENTEDIHPPYVHDLGLSAGTEILE